MLSLLSLPIMSGNVAAFDFDKFKNKLQKVKDAKKNSDKAKKLKNAFGSKSEKEEIQLGGLATSTLLGAAGLVPNAELQNYVNQVGLWVASQSERPDLPWRFGVIQSDGINAFAAPGGYIIVTYGLFMVLSNEAELAGVLGHEIAHVVQKHHLKELKKGSRLEVLGDVLAHQADAKHRKNVNKLVDASKTVYTRGLSRRDEYDADRMGVVYVARAGYDPYAMLSVLTTLETIKSDSSNMALFTQTHPPLADRLSLLDRLMDGRMDRYASQPVVADRFVAMQQKLLK